MVKTLSKITIFRGLKSNFLNFILSICLGNRRKFSLRLSFLENAHFQNNWNFQQISALWIICMCLFFFFSSNMFLKESSNFNWKFAVILYFEILGSGKKDYHLIRLWSLGSITCLYCKIVWSEWMFCYFLMKDTFKYALFSCWNISKIFRQKKKGPVFFTVPFFFP